MKKKNIRPTDSELEILQVLWHKGPSTVREVNDLVGRDKEVGYTTTLKLMQIMTEKGLLSREKDSRTHIYTPVSDMDTTRAELLDRFLESAFSGSASSLVMQALGNHNASASELQEIKALIEQLEKDNGEPGK